MRTEKEIRERRDELFEGWEQSITTLKSKFAAQVALLTWVLEDGDEDADKKN